MCFWKELKLYEVRKVQKREETCKKDWQLEDAVQRDLLVASQALDIANPVWMPMPCLAPIIISMNNSNMWALPLALAHITRQFLKKFCLPRDLLVTSQALDISNPVWNMTVMMPKAVRFYQASMRESTQKDVLSQRHRGGQVVPLGNNQLLQKIYKS